MLIVMKVDGYEHNLASVCMTDDRAENSSPKQSAQLHADHDFNRWIKPTITIQTMANDVVEEPVTNKS